MSRLKLLISHTPLRHLKACMIRNPLLKFLYIRCMNIQSNITQSILESRYEWRLNDADSELGMERESTAAYVINYAINGPDTLVPY